jgi:hypothetical protein
MAKSSSQWGAFVPLIYPEKSSAPRAVREENLIGNTTGSAALVGAAAGHPEALTCIASPSFTSLRSQPFHKLMPKAEKPRSMAGLDAPVK